MRKFRKDYLFHPSFAPGEWWKKNFTLIIANWGLNASFPIICIDSQFVIPKVIAPMIVFTFLKWFCLRVCKKKKKLQPVADPICAVSRWTTHRRFGGCPGWRRVSTAVGHACSRWPRGSYHVTWAPPVPTGNASRAPQEKPLLTMSRVSR